MADFFFFTDVKALSGQQLKVDAFGEVSDLKYKVDNSFSVIENAPAIAVLEGIPFVQQCTDNQDCVNIILYPLNNPKFDFPAIKFLVYRGIKKSSLFGEDGVIKETNATWKTSNILKILHELQDKINSDNGDTGTDRPKPKSENLGYHYSVSGTNFKADDFYVETATFLRDAIQLPVVKAGCQIGQYIGGAIAKASFQIIQDRLGYEPTLGEVRSKEAAVEVSAAQNATKEAIFDHWHQKEQILTYVDPAAFYGCAKANGIKVKTYNGQNVIKEHASKIVDLFYNKQVVYLDIRNDQNYSYDYYDSFGKQIKLSFEQEGSRELISESVNYYTNWPLLKLENRKFPQKRSKSKIIFQLPFMGISDDLSRYYLNSFTHKFKPETTSSTVFHHLNQLEGKKQFLIGNSEKITLENWVNDSGNLGANYFVFKYSVIQYSACEGLSRSSMMDALFSLDMKLLLGDTDLEDGDFQTYIYSSINAPLIDKVTGADDSQDLYLPVVGIAKDKDQITFFAFRDKVGFSADGDQLNYPMSIVRKGDYENSVLLDEFEYDPNNKSLGFLAALPFRINGTTGLQLKKVKHPFFQNNTEENREYLYYLNTTPKELGKFYIDPRTFDAITITHEEYKALKALQETKGYKYRTYLQMLEKEANSTAGYHLTEMEMLLKSVKANNSKNILEETETALEDANKVMLNGLITKG